MAEVLTWGVIRTGLHTVACLQAGLVYWCVGVAATLTRFLAPREEF